MKILSLAFTFFLLMDSIGNIPLFIALLKDFSPANQRRIIRRELLIALGIIVLFSLIGDVLLRLIQIKTHTILIAGGLILFLIAIHMIFPSAHPNHDPSLDREKEPFIVPLAIPLIAGPAVLASVMIYAQQESHWVTISAIVIAWLASVLILLSASYLKKILGQKGLLACERLMGLLLTLIAIQMLLQGITFYIEELRSSMT